MKRQGRILGLALRKSGILQLPATVLCLDLIVAKMLPPKSYRCLSWQFSFMVMTLVLCALVDSQTDSSQVCDCCLCLHGHCYITTEKSDDYLTFFYDIDHYANIFYFKADWGSIKTLNVTGSIKNLNTMSLATLQIRHRVKHLALDHNSGNLYFSGPDGLFKYLAAEEPKSIPINIDNYDNINNMWVHNETVYLNLSGKLKVVHGSSVQKISALDNVQDNVEDFVIDKKGNMYVSTKNKVYKIKVNEVEPTIVSEKSGKFSSDRSGDVYLYDATKIYQIDSASGKFEMVGIINAFVGWSYVLFDKDGSWILTHSTCFYRHRKSSKKCSIDENGRIIRLPVGPGPVAS